jgi:hypothetical protein
MASPRSVRAAGKAANVRVIEGYKKWRDGLFIPENHEPGKQNLHSRKNLKAAQAANAKIKKKR